MVLTQARAASRTPPPAPREIPLVSGWGLDYVCRPCVLTLWLDLAGFRFRKRRWGVAGLVCSLTISYEWKGYADGVPWFLSAVRRVGMMVMVFVA